MFHRNKIKIKMEIQGNRKTNKKTMKSQKRWYWEGLLVVVFALATAATLVKGDSPGGLRKFQAEDTMLQFGFGCRSIGTINGNEIASGTIADNGYALSSLGATGNGRTNAFWMVV